MKTLERSIFLSFTDELGSRAEVTLGTYEIKTDESVWPYEDYNTTEGNYILSYQVATTGIRSDMYLTVWFTKSTVEYEIVRSYGKIDDLLAYIGGFFSLIFFV